MVLQNKLRLLPTGLRSDFWIAPGFIFKVVMKLRDLKDILDRHPNLDRVLDCEISIHLAEPSMGPIAMSGVRSGHFGFDWESGHFILEPSVNLARLKQKEALWQAANDFIYMLSKDVRYYKGVAKETELAKRAKEIIERSRLKAGDE